MLPRRSVASLWTKQSSQLSLPGRITYRIYCPGVQQSRRYSQHHGSESRPSSSSRKTLVVSSLVLAATAALGAGVYQRNLRVNATRGDHNEAAEDCNPLARVPFRTLLRGYFVYTCCSIPILVDCGPAVVDWCRATSIPGVWSCFEFVVRNTFFPQVSEMVSKLV
jgi:proline dehydrogenase